MSLLNKRSMLHKQSLWELPVEVTAFDNLLGTHYKNTLELVTQLCASCAWIPHTRRGVHKIENRAVRFVWPTWRRLVWGCFYRWKTRKTRSSRSPASSWTRAKITLVCARVQDSAFRDFSTIKTPSNRLQAGYALWCNNTDVYISTTWKQPWMRLFKAWRLETQAILFYKIKNNLADISFSSRIQPILISPKPHAFL